MSTFSSYVCLHTYIHQFVYVCVCLGLLAEFEDVHLFVHACHCIYTYVCVLLGLYFVYLVVYVCERTCGFVMLFISLSTVMNK